MSRKFFYLLLLILIFGNCQVEPLTVIAAGISITKLAIDAANLLSTYLTIKSGVFDEAAVGQNNYYSDTSVREAVQQLLEYVKFVPDDVVTNYKYEEIKKNCREVDQLYRHPETLFSNDYVNDTLKSHAIQTMNQFTGVPSYMNKIRTTFQGSDGATFLKNLLRQSKQHCSAISDQRFLDNIVRLYLETEQKALTLILLAFAIKQKFVKTDLTNEKMSFVKTQIQGIETTLIDFKKIMASVSRYQQSCDLINSHKEEYTYAYFQNVFQRVIFPREDVQDRKTIVRYPGSNLPLTKPLDQCPDPQDKNGVVPKCYQDNKCTYNQRKCNRLVDCKEELHYNICLANDLSSIRRYFYATKNRPAKTCDKKVGTEKYVERACNCICDEINQDDYSSRYIDLKDVLSRVDSNRVVTGIRFRKHLRTMYLEIKEAELVNGTINKKSSSWRQFVRGDRDYTKKDIYEIRWFNQRSLYLDFHEVDNNNVITGVRFATEKIGNDLAVKFEVQRTEVDKKNWKLKSGTSKWVSTQHSAKTSKEVNVAFEAPKNLNNKIHVINEIIEPNRFIRFSPTNIESIDAGQTVVPYFDVQEVDVEERICGLGIDFAKAENSGGYLKPIVKHCDILIELK